VDGSLPATLPVVARPAEDSVLLEFAAALQKALEM
jgi:Asp-tRNA(Asn)/Glu-tRNA(Gln) amidotransferase A subunit family amidase